jgi:catechol 2,3-dioxygenase-like lactoylglutathione lyase family enzyme
MKNNRHLKFLASRWSFLWVLVAALATVGAVLAEAPRLDHVQLTTSSPPVAVKWYLTHMGCDAIEGRNDAADCGAVEIEFVANPLMGSSQGTGIDHIGFSYADLDEKMAELEEAGVGGSGVRLQRFEDGSTLRDVPGLFKYGFVFDPWGTRIELVEDQETLGFHHIHLQSADPEKALQWYETMFGGERSKLKGQLDGLKLASRGAQPVWLLASRHPDGIPASTEGRSIDHFGFVMADLVDGVGGLNSKGAMFLRDPAVPKNGRSAARQAMVSAPDNVSVALVEPGWAGVDSSLGAAADVATRAAAGEAFEIPRTPWGEPDLQGIFTANAAHGIPLERGEGGDDRESLTPEEAAARRERGTLGSIWGYEREWRDTTLGYVKSAPSTQVAMVIDPPDGRIPEMTDNGKAVVKAEADAGNYTTKPAEGPEDLTPYVRCISRGLPGLMMPSIYNNGLQIVQSPGNVAIQKEMIHEVRVIPTRERPRLGDGLAQWLGDPQGRWEGDTLVIETANFNGGAPYRGSGRNLKLTERFRLVGPDTLEYRFTVDDPSIWTRPWTGMFHFERDTEQYELVEYACHEGNYGMTNILSGARAREREAAAVTDNSGEPNKP